MVEAPAEALRAVVHGYVQGVGYRAFVQGRARALGLRGFARNRSDGVSVEVVAEGPRAALEALLAELEKGPAAAFVERIDAGWSAANGSFEGFVTR